LRRGYENVRRRCLQIARGLPSRWLFREEEKFSYARVEIGNRDLVAKRERAVFSSRKRTPKLTQTRKCAVLWDKLKRAERALDCYAERQ
jgi:hypothetical protein